MNAQLNKNVKNQFLTVKVIVNVIHFLQNFMEIAFKNMMNVK